jgi:hypothetical protein
MPDIRCSKCGQPTPADSAGLCLDCAAATAIATPEDAAAAKVTPPETAVREGEPPLELPRAPEPWPYKHEPGPGWALGWGCLAVCAIGAVVLAGTGLIVIPLYTYLREAAQRSETMNKMRIIAMACHAHHDVHKGFPPPKMTLEKDGNKRVVELSWRVSILPGPGLNQPRLHDDFNLKEPWDGDANTRLQNEMPAVYFDPYRQWSKGKETHFQYFTGPDTLFTEPSSARYTLGKIPDGSSNTFLFAQCQQAVIWTRPADMAIKRGEPLPLPPTFFFAAMADASVNKIDRQRVSDRVLRQLIDPNDGGPDGDWDR